jgi:flagellar basal body rod protein FlgG
MLAGLYSAATGMNTAARQHEIIARNLAHASVPGYRRELMVSQTFEAALGAEMVPPSGHEAWGVQAMDVVTDFGQGPIHRTEQPLDAAIDGPGFFVVAPADSDELFYTRNGTFQRSPTGELVTAEGLLVQGEGGPITIPPNISLTEISIGIDGGVRSGKTEFGKLQIADFADPTQLRPVGATMFIADDLETIDPTGRVLGGARELSNVSAVEELIAMIAGMRHYESSQRALRSISEAVAQNTNPQG